MDDSSIDNVNVADKEGFHIPETERPHAELALKEFLEAQSNGDENGMYYAVFVLAAKLKRSRADGADIDKLTPEDIHNQIISWMNDETEESQEQFEKYFYLALGQMEEVYGEG